MKPGRTNARCSKCSIAHYAKTAAPCTVRTCERPSLAKGMCSTHYSWYWRALRGVPTNGRGTWIMPSRRLSIYERDDWMCKICGEPVDHDADVGDNMAPSLDHIVPRSLGGGHESENLRTAHRVCNSRRGANVEGVSHDEWASPVRDYRGGASSPAEPGAVWAAV
ncbi:HNH endonuclease [Acinetobacter baumannii]|nr:HNH endonuclease [Acinetobacter baumannii]